MYLLFRREKGETENLVIDNNFGLLYSTIFLLFTKVIYTGRAAHFMFANN